jgi:hypothetical protein
MIILSISLIDKDKQKTPATGGFGNSLIKTSDCANQKLPDRRLVCTVGMMMEELNN